MMEAPSTREITSSHYNNGGPGPGPGPGGAPPPRRRRDRAGLSNVMWMVNKAEEHETADTLQPSSFRRRGYRNSLIGSSNGQMSSSLRRGALTPGTAFKYTSQMVDLETETLAKDWLISLARLDPRRQILDFFNDLALEGVDHFESKGGIDAQFAKACPNLLRAFTKNGMFTVWRPTSNDAIRKRITGEGTGKGLDIKGKSALRGVYSGYVPYLQISENDHKTDVGPMLADKRVRVFYPNRVSRDEAKRQLSLLSRKWLLRLGKYSLKGGGRGGKNRLSDSLQAAEEDEGGVEVPKHSMDDPRVYDIDDYAGENGIYGIDIPEKLLWEGYIVPADISRPAGSKFDTGRASMPAFQQMNIDTIRNWVDCTEDGDDDDNDKNDNDDDSECMGADPRPVLWHSGCGTRYTTKLTSGLDPLCPQGLLMAYEEVGKVTPVVSDFDCFLLGTRGVKYEKALGKNELHMLSWCIDEIDGILSNPKGRSWTERWLSVKKKCMHKLGHKPMPKFGYADPRSYSIIKGAVERLKGNGSVRHGPECFNYAFPQDLDNKFLVVSDTFPDVPWRYVGIPELIDILYEKIDEGFTFPLNPKWILCDEGWRGVYDKLLASQHANVQDSLNIWYPPEIRDRIDEVSFNNPRGFCDVCKNEVEEEAKETKDALFMSKKTRATLAQFELMKYLNGMSSNDSLGNNVPRARGNNLFYSVLNEGIEGLDVEDMAEDGYFSDIAEMSDEDSFSDS